MDGRGHLPRARTRPGRPPGVVGSSSSAPAARNAAAMIEVREVPGREVDGERAGQQPRERRSDRARSAAHQGRGRETDRHAKRDLQRRGRLDDREREGPLEDERQRRRAGPVGDRRESVDAREPGPPEVDRRVRTHREPGASRGERPEEPPEQDEGEGRDQERVGPVRSPVRGATPARRTSRLVARSSSRPRQNDPASPVVTSVGSVAGTYHGSVARPAAASIAPCSTAISPRRSSAPPAPAAAGSRSCSSRNAWASRCAWTTARSRRSPPVSIAAPASGWGTGHRSGTRTRTASTATRSCTPPRRPPRR